MTFDQLSNGEIRELFPGFKELGSRRKELMRDEDINHGDVTGESMEIVGGVRRRARRPIEEENSMVRVCLGLENLDY